MTSPGEVHGRNQAQRLALKPLEVATDFVMDAGGVRLLKLTVACSHDFLLSCREDPYKRGLKRKQ